MDNRDKTINENKTIKKTAGKVLPAETNIPDTAVLGNEKNTIPQAVDKGHDAKGSDTSETDEKKEKENTENDHSDDSDNEDDGQDEIETKSIVITSPSFLELLPGKYGTLLAALITNILTEGLTAQQENILGNFLSAVGSLIAYKASRDELDENNNNDD